MLTNKLCVSSIKQLRLKSRDIKKYLQISLWKKSFCDFIMRDEIFVLVSNLITVFTLINLKVKILHRDPDTLISLSLNKMLVEWILLYKRPYRFGVSSLDPSTLIFAGRALIGSSYFSLNSGLTLMMGFLVSSLSFSYCWLSGRSVAPALVS